MKESILKLLNNKKLMIIIGGVSAIVATAVVVAVVVANTGATSYAKKLKNYLVKVGYDCDGIYKHDNGSLDTKGNYFYCQMTTSNGIYKEMIINKHYNDASKVVYKESVYDTYSLTIKGEYYTRGSLSEFISYYDDIENKTFDFISKGNGFEIGEIVNCDIISDKIACEDDVKDVNKAMREFESYFEGAKLKLQQ